MQLKAQTISNRLADADFLAQEIFSFFQGVLHVRSGLILLNLAPIPTIVSPITAALP
jgi:hypothetical protein